MIPQVTITREDNQLGVVPPAQSDRMAVIACASAGTDEAYLAARASDVVAEHESGPLVHTVCYAISKTGAPVLVVRAATQTPGSYGTVDNTGITGACTAEAGDGVPVDDFEAYVEIVAGGVVGTAGITYRTSLDDGRTLSGVQALGTDTEIDCGGGVVFDLPVAQTFTANASTDVFTFSGAGFADGTPIRLVGTDLPAPLVAGTTYYTRDRATNTSKLAATSGGVAIELDDAGSGTLTTQHTLVAGDVIRCRTSAPQFDAAGLAAALEKVRLSSFPVDIIQLYAPMTSTLAATIAAAKAAMATAGREALFVTNFRMRGVNESRSAYATAYATETSAIDDIDLIVCYEQAEIQSPVDQRRYMRPISVDVSAALVAVNPGRDIAAKKLGPRSGVTIVDARGNVKHHDDFKLGGVADALRATSLRTWPSNGTQTFITNPRLMSASGSDYQFAQHARVSHKVCKIVRAILEERSSEDLIVSASTGYIDETDANDIDVEVNAALNDALVKTRNASAIAFVLNRTDNLLSTFTLKGTARIIPLAYPKFFEVTVGFFNPALRAVEV